LKREPNNQEIDMQYQTSTPRAALALAAIALTVVTLALSVFIPAHLGTSLSPSETIVADAPTRVERIDVIAVRQANVATTHGRVARRKQQEG
jgi:hypothetical protein